MAEYKKVRKQEQKKKETNYQKNAKKAGIFEDYTAFYTKRGTDTKQGWYTDANHGHRMAKTKYSFDTQKDGKKYDGGQKWNWMQYNFISTQGKGNASFVKSTFEQTMVYIK